MKMSNVKPNYTLTQLYELLDLSKDLGLNDDAILWQSMIDARESMSVDCGGWEDS